MVNFLKKRLFIILNSSSIWLIPPSPMPLTKLWKLWPKLSNLGIVRSLYPLHGVQWNFLMPCDSLLSTSKLYRKLSIFHYNKIIYYLRNQKYRILQFELSFERAIVFWTSTWRSVYLNFVRRSIEVSEESFVPASPGFEDKTHFFQSKVQESETELHPSTISCLAFCKALCDDFLRLKINAQSTMLLCCLQIANVSSSFFF